VCSWEEGLAGQEMANPASSDNALAGIFVRNIKPEPNFNKNSTGIRAAQGLWRLPGSQKHILPNVQAKRQAVDQNTQKRLQKIRVLGDYGEGLWQT
jgi:hypothetical protein